MNRSHTDEKGREHARMNHTHTHTPTNMHTHTQHTTHTHNTQHTHTDTHTHKILSCNGIVQVPDAIVRVSPGYNRSLLRQDALDTLVRVERGGEGRGGEGRGGEARGTLIIEPL